MFIPKTLLLYISRKFLLHLIAATLCISSLCFFASLAETARRLIARDHTSSLLISKMSLFQTPGLIENAFPFIFLISAMTCFFSLSRRHELNAAHSTGVSAWMLLSPAIIISLLAGVMIVTLFNPASASMSSEYKELKARYIKHKTSLLAVSDTGLWLRQNDGQRQSVIHARQADAQGINLSQVTIFLYEGEDRFVGRIDAQTAQLKNGHWELRDVWLINTNDQPRFLPAYQQTTSLTSEQIYESFAAPETISFWKLPRFIELTKASGFSVTAYLFHWHGLIALPAFLAAMALVGAAASLLFIARQGGEIRLVTSVILFGFLIYSLNFLGRKIGASFDVPILFSVWAPIAVTSCTGLILLLQREEG